MPIYAKGESVVSKSFNSFPISISDNARSDVLQLSIAGNSIQVGTPTPSVPVAPNMCGKKVGNDWVIPVACGEQTMNVYLGQASTVRRIKKRVFNGSENWTVWVYLTAVMFYTPVTDGTGNQVLSSHFGTRKSGSFPIVGNVVYNGDSNKNMIFRMLDDTTITTVDGFKAWLAAQYAAGTPVTVWYVLATPETGIVNEPLCKIDTDYDEFVSPAGTQSLTLSTNIANTISFDTASQPSVFTIRYYGVEYYQINSVPTVNNKEIKYIVDKDGRYVYRTLPSS